MDDAKVVCRQLGLPWGSPKAVKGAYHGAGSGPIWLDNVKCDGSETVLVNCTSNGWRTHNCDHEDDASVSCTGKTVVQVAVQVRNKCIRGQHVHHKHVYASKTFNMYARVMH